MHKKSAYLLIAAISLFPLSSCSVLGSLFSNDSQTSTNQNNSFFGGSEDVTEEETGKKDDEEASDHTGNNDNVDNVGESKVKQYSVRWFIDGKMYTEYYVEGATPKYEGEVTKAPTKEYEFIFVGWEPEIHPVNAHQTYTAIFNKVKRKYTVTFYNYDNSIVAEEKYEYGEVPEFKGEEPTRPADSELKYTFSGWAPNYSPVTNNQNYYAQYSSKSAKLYDITFSIDGKNYTTQYEYGEMPSFDGAIEKASTIAWSYNFIRWDPNIEAVTGDKVYTAIFEQVRRKYNVIFKINEKNESITQQYNYFDMPAYGGSSINSDGYVMVGQNVYKFNGWDPQLRRIEEDNKVFTAKLTKIQSDYFYAWYHNDVNWVYTKVMPTKDGIDEVVEKEKNLSDKDKKGFKVYVYRIDASKNKAVLDGDAQAYYSYDVKNKTTTFYLNYARVTFMKSGNDSNRYASIY